MSRIADQVRCKGNVTAQLCSCLRCVPRQEALAHTRPSLLPHACGGHTACVSQGHIAFCHTPAFLCRCLCGAPSCRGYMFPLTIGEVAKPASVVQHAHVANGSDSDKPNSGGGRPGLGGHRAGHHSHHHNGSLRSSNSNSQSGSGRKGCVVAGAARGRGRPASAKQRGAQDNGVSGNGHASDPQQAQSKRKHMGGGSGALHRLSRPPLPPAKAGLVGLVGLPSSSMARKRMAAACRGGSRPGRGRGGGGGGSQRRPGSSSNEPSEGSSGSYEGSSSDGGGDGAADAHVVTSSHAAQRKGMYQMVLHAFAAQRSADAGCL
jgi:hypothetical protein